MDTHQTQAPAATASPERILARQLARELSQQELDEVSGGMMSRVFTGRSSTVCCDIDGSCDC